VCIAGALAKPVLPGLEALNKTAHDNGRTVNVQQLKHPGAIVPLKFVQQRAHLGEAFRWKDVHHGRLIGGGVLCVVARHPLVGYTTEQSVLRAELGTCHRPPLLNTEGSPGNFSMREGQWNPRVAAVRE
jgi:hypothetical protein